MRKKFLSVLLLVLILVSIYFTFFHNHGFNIEEFNLNSEDTSSLNGISISESSDTIKLIKSEGLWKVNGRYYANQLLISQLLRIFMNMELDVLVPEHEKDSVIEHLKKDARKLIFYENAEPVGEYWIDHYNEFKQSTLIMDNRNVPAYIVAPGLTSNIFKFVITDPLLWRDKFIFKIDPKLISIIELEYFRQNSGSFKIEKKSEDFLLLDAKGNSLNYDKSKLLRYISYFRNIMFDSLIEDLTYVQQDSIINQEPLLKIKVTDIAQQSVSLILYPKKAQNKMNENDLDYVYGLLNSEKPLISLRYFQIDPILKDISYFN